ncbi:MAG: YjbF family lipoprotein [Rhodobacteraceae bacterium]|nr:YjbF family lipoprotein [Paracoccaceae bacterium]
MKKTLGLLIMALGLSACTSAGQSNPVVSAIWQKVKPGARAAAREEDAIAAARPPIVVTFKKIKDTGLAIVRARVGDDTKGVMLYARSVNDDYVTYASQLQQTMTLRGSLITASRAIGYDMLAMRSDPIDPVARPTPPEAWPTKLRRDYRFAGDTPGGRLISVECRFTKGPAFELALLDKTFDTTIMQGECAGDGVKFTNIHFVQVDGQILRSAQWLGPDQGMVEIDILEPYTP